MSEIDKHKLPTVFDVEGFQLKDGEWPVCPWHRADTTGAVLEHDGWKIMFVCGCVLELPACWKFTGEHGQEMSDGRKKDGTK